MRRRRSVEAFSLSFLDCICCGFGAIILLLVLSKIYEPVVIEKAENNLQQLIALLQQELFELRGQTTILDRELKVVKEDAASTQKYLAELQGDLNKIRGQYQASKQNEEETMPVAATGRTHVRPADCVGAGRAHHVEHYIVPPSLVADGRQESIEHLGGELRTKREVGCEHLP